MPLEKSIITTVRRTPPLPGADLQNVTGPLVGLDYFNRIKESGKLRGEQLREMFKGRTLVRVSSGNHELTVVTRPEFDAPPGTDHMIVVIPSADDQKTPWDYYQLAESDPTAGVDFVKSIFTVLDSYRDLGCSECLAVLNTSAYDNGLFVDDNGVHHKKRLSQSMRFVHAKTYGYFDAGLNEDIPTRGELDLIVRPLQGELNALVRHVAGQLSVNVYDEPGFAPLGIKLKNPSEFPEIYARVHEFMTEAAGYTIGPRDVSIKMSAPVGDQVTLVHGVFLQEPSRVTRENALTNIAAFSSCLKKDNSETSCEFHSTSTYFKHDDVARHLLASYLDGVSNVISQNENMIIPFGPHFTVMFEFNPAGEPVAYFIPADYVPKGANPVSGIIPTESHRPLTGKEKKQMRQGADNVVNFLAETFGDDRVQTR